MSKQVANLQETVGYVLGILRSYGIDCVSSEEIRQAKFNQRAKGEAGLLKAVYGLLLLHLTEFRLSPKVMAKILDNFVEEPQTITVMIYYLHVLNSPFIIRGIQPDEIYLDTSSTRNMLLLFGWLIQKIGLFNAYDSKIANKFLKPLEEIAAKVGEGKAKKDGDGEENREEEKVTDKRKNVKGNPFGPDEINFDVLLSRIIRVKLLLQKIDESYQSYANKAANLKKTYNIELNEVQFLNGQESLRMIDGVIDEMKAKIAKEVEGRKHREVFWLWLENVVDCDKSDFNNDPNYGFGEDMEKMEHIIEGSCRPVYIMKGGLEELNEVSERWSRVQKKLEPVKELHSQFVNMWEQLSQSLSSGNKEVLDHLKKNLPTIIKELEEKYFTLEEENETPEILAEILGNCYVDTFLGEISVALEEANYLEDPIDSQKDKTKSKGLLNEEVERCGTKLLSYKDEIKKYVMEHLCAMAEHIKVI